MKKWKQMEWSEKREILTMIEGVGYLFIATVAPIMFGWLFIATLASEESTPFVILFSGGLFALYLGIFIWMIVACIIPAVKQVYGKKEGDSGNT